MDDLLCIFLIVALLFVPYGDPKKSNFDRVYEAYTNYETGVANGRNP